MGTFKEYYKFDPNLTIREISKRWKEDHEMFGDDHIHGYLPLKEIWPFREYTWTRDTSRAGYVRVDGEYKEMKGPQKWDHLKKDMKENGWREDEQPVILSVGRDGNVKVSEGNHRLAIAREIGLQKVPVRFDFRQKVSGGEKVSKSIPKKVASRYYQKRSSFKGPDQWFLNKEYHPMEGGFEYNENLPSGNSHPLDLVNLREKTKTEGETDKELGSNRNTIEMVLLRSDLSSEKVETAMSILPSMRDFYEFLKQHGEYDTALVVKSIMNYY